MTLAFLGWSVPIQILFNGLALGLGYAVIAAGIVLIFRSSGIINFAQAAMGAFGVASFVVLFQTYDLPYPIAAVLGVAGAAALGVGTELLVVRRLFNSSRVVLLIATVGVAQLIALLILEVLPDVQGGAIPVAFDAAWAEIHVTDSLVIGSRQTSLIVLIAPVLVWLAWFLNRTRTGLHIRAVADNPENARLIGVSPRRVSTLVWGLAAGVRRLHPDRHRADRDPDGGRARRRVVHRAPPAGPGDRHGRPDAVDPGRRRSAASRWGWPRRSSPST